MLYFFFFFQTMNTIQVEIDTMLILIKEGELSKSVKLFLCKSIVRHQLVTIKHFKLKHTLLRDTTTGLDVHQCEHKCNTVDECREDLVSVYKRYEKELYSNDYSLLLVTFLNYFQHALHCDISSWLIIDTLKRLIPLVAPQISRNGEEIVKKFYSSHYLFTVCAWYRDVKHIFEHKVGNFKSEEGYVYLENITILENKFVLSQKSDVNLKNVINDLPGAKVFDFSPNSSMVIYPRFLKKP